MSYSHHTSSTTLFVKFATVVIFLYLPTLYCFFALQPRLNNRPRGGTISNTTLFWIYILTGILGGRIAGHIQATNSKLLAYLCFRDRGTRARYLTEIYRLKDVSHPADMSLTREMSLDPRYWLFRLLVDFGSTALFEESIKFLAVAPFLHGSIRNVHQVLDANGRLQWDTAWLSAAIAAGLGFSTFENILYSKMELRKTNGGYLVSMAIQRSLFCTTGHVMLVVLSAVNFLSCSVKDEPVNKLRSLWQVLGTSTLVHGGYNFGLYTLRMMSDDGWIHPGGGVAVYSALAMPIAVLTTLTMLIRKR